MQFGNPGIDCPRVLASRLYGSWFARSPSTPGPFVVPWSRTNSNNAEGHHMDEGQSFWNHSFEPTIRFNAKRCGPLATMMLLGVCLSGCSSSPPSEVDILSLLESQSEGARIVGLKVDGITSIEADPFPCGGKLGSHGPTFKVSLAFTKDLGTCEKRGGFIPVPGWSCGQPYLKGVMCVEKVDGGKWAVASSHLLPGIPPDKK